MLTARTRRIGYIAGVIALGVLAFDLVLIATGEPIYIGSKRSMSDRNILAAVSGGENDGKTRLTCRYWNGKGVEEHDWDDSDGRFPCPSRWTY